MPLELLKQVGGLIAAFFSQVAARMLGTMTLFWIFAASGLYHKLSARMKPWAHIIWGEFTIIWMFGIWDVAWLNALGFIYYFFVYYGRPYSAAVVSLILTEATHIYLLVYRGDDWAMDCSAPGMMYMLRVISTAFNVYDGINAESIKKRWSGVSDRSIARLVSVGLEKPPSLVNWFAYLLTPAGGICAPYYEYKVFERVLEGRPAGPKSWRHMLHCLAYCFVVQFALIYVTWDLSYGSEWYNALNPIVRSLCVPIITTLCASRYFPAWLIVDAQMEALGGWTDCPVPVSEVSNHNFLWVLNISDVGEWFRRWNHTAHVFWRNYLFTRCVKFVGSLGAGLLVFVCSSVWHGFRPNMWIMLPELLLMSQVDALWMKRYPPKTALARFGRWFLVIWSQLYVTATWFFPWMYQCFRVRASVWFLPTIAYAIAGIVLWLLSGRSSKSTKAEVQPVSAAVESR